MVFCCPNFCGNLSYTKESPWYYVSMGMRKESICLDEYYHIYNRGVDKRIIYLTDNDRIRFIRLLHLCNGKKPVVYRNVQTRFLNQIEVGEKLVAIGAYCLMPNHFHILAKETTEGGIEKFMRKLLTSYSMYFNKNYERTGALFEGEFKAVHLDSDEYLKYIYSYIHLNPVKIIDPSWKEKGIVDLSKTEAFLKEYTYSSYRDYLGEKREFSAVLNRSVFPDYFQNEKDLSGHIQDWLNFNKDFSM